MPDSDSKSTGGQWWIKPLVIVAVMATLAVVYFLNREALSLTALAEQQDQIVAFQQQHPVLVLLLAYALYTTITGLSIPGAAITTLMFGWFFALVYGDTYGLLVAALIVSFASTSGATLAFLSSRYLVGKPIQDKFGERLAKFNEALDREGPFFLFTLRLIPAVPFMVINLVMGLTRIRVRTFWWVSQIGMLPGTIVYVFAGTKLPGPKDILEEGASGVLTWEIIAAFVLLGVFPFIVRGVMKRVRPSSAQHTV